MYCHSCGEVLEANDRDTCALTDEGVLCVDCRDDLRD